MTKAEELDWIYRLRSNIYIYIYIYVYMPKEWLIPMDNALGAGTGKTHTLVVRIARFFCI